ncbi:MAG: flagella cluster protein [Halobacteria archaeon]|nr:flagella cluster protein [Halobacteria archaeon]
MCSPIDLDSERRKLKLVKDAGTKRSFRNMKGLDCPACGREFEVVMESEETCNSFSPDKPFSFCVVRGDERIQLYRH